MRVVIDTNIIVSAFLSPTGNCSIFMNRVFSGIYDIYVTESILDEYNKVLHKDKFRFAENDINYILNWFRNNAILVDVNENDYSPSDFPDPDDAIFFITARATRSKLVTGNIKHYPVDELRTMLWEVI